MKRERFLSQAAIAAAACAMPRLARAAAVDDAFAPEPRSWRTFELTTSIELPAGDAARAWVPLPAFAASDWIRPSASTWMTKAALAEVRRDPPWSAEMLYLEWPSDSSPRTAQIKSRVMTRDRSVDLARAANGIELSDTERRQYTAPTDLIPTDGIVKAKADEITSGAQTDLERARKIYEWVVASTFRDPKTRGCGLGNIKAMLLTGDYGGKCADINGLYVGLARAAGLPARDLYGIRVAPSRFGYKSLGANTSDVTKSQHCRAEVHLAGVGWVPVDPADVRKVALEEPPGNLPMTDPKVVAAHRTLFGAWETNWIAYNDAPDVRLPGSAGEPIGFLMYPQAEVAGVRSDSLDAKTFVYRIDARELTG